MFRNTAHQCSVPFGPKAFNTRNMRSVHRPAPPATHDGALMAVDEPIMVDNHPGFEAGIIVRPNFDINQ